VRRYARRMTPTCPSCKADLYTVKPVRIKTDPDSPRWKGRVPDALGFACGNCTALLPLTVTQERDDA